MSEKELNENKPAGHKIHKTIHLSGMYEDWFLDYASYVILERAVPDIRDGLKPVHRRILHAMREMDDGRYNKVANIIGNTMKYHPHGDASIGDALVQLGQKDYLIDTQGNWGNIATGDRAAAPRYIEARLSEFARTVVFNPKTTVWKDSYDGRNKEPVSLPVKFPLLLLQGVEGIAVGLASKILPHNFNELIDASIAYLRGKDFEIFPDFPTGGYIDVSQYKDGLRGGKIKVRAKIRQVDKRTLEISDLPYGVTTLSLIDSIISANEKGKIKIQKVDDNTAENVEIIVHLPKGVSPDQTIDALYAFTKCEQSISPNACVIQGDKPAFLGVKEILKHSTDHTVNLLKQELEIAMQELLEKWHFASLEKIFIEKRIYHDIEESESWEEVLTTIDKGLEPYKKLFKREITRDDIIRLTEIKIKRISKYNTFKAEEFIQNVENEIEEVQNHLNHLVDYAVHYFKQIKRRFGKGRTRKTEIRDFENIDATKVAALTEKLYIDRQEGFAGTSLRKAEFVSECSDIDDIIVFRKDGTFFVTKVSPKFFVGKDVIHIAVFKKNDTRTIYNYIYRDGRQGPARVKRFFVTSITRDKEYILTKGAKYSKVLYFTANPNGEAERIKVYLVPKPKLRKTSFEFDFSTLAIKGKGSQGNILTPHAINKIVVKEEGVSTLGARKIWYDESIRKINEDERGVFLGEFKGNDKILSLHENGTFRLTNFDLSKHYPENIVEIQKFDPEKVLSVLYYDGEQKKYYVKRFRIDANTSPDKYISFIGDSAKNKLISFSFDFLPQLQLVYDAKKNGKEYEDDIVNVAEFIGIKGVSAKGKRLTNKYVKKLFFTTPLPYTPPPGETEPEKKPDDNPDNDDDIPLNVDENGQITLF